MLKAIPAFGAVLVASALLLPTASLASPISSSDDELVTATVSYADLDLAHPTGVSALKYRIKTAAQTVCGAPYAFEILRNPARVECIDGAVASAQPEFDRVVNAARRGSVIISSAAAMTVTARR